MGNKKHLRILTMEGIPAITIFYLLGGPLQTGYLLFLGASPVQVGIAASIPSLVNVIQILAALFLQKVHNRKLLMTILCGMHRMIWVSTGAIPFLFPERLWIPAYLTMFTLGFIGNALGGVAWTSLVADIVPAAVRGQYFGFRNMVLNGIGSVCLFTGGWALDTYPGETGFYLLYGVCAVMAVWNIITFTLYPNEPFERSKESNRLRMISKPFQEPKFLKSMMFIALWLFLQGMALPMFSYAMLDVLELNVRWVTAASVVQNAAAMASTIIWGRLNGKHPSRTLLFWTLPVISGACLLWGLVGILPTVSVMFGVHILVGVGTGGFNLLMFNFSIGDTPKSERPMYIAVFSALTGMAAFAGSTLGGYLFEWTAGAPEWLQNKGIFTLLGAVLLTVALTVGPFALRDRVRKAKGNSSSAVSG
jgi:MFS family permease